MLNFVHVIDESLSIDKWVEKRYTIYSERPIKQEEQKMYMTKVIVEKLNCPINGCYTWATTLMESLDDGITWQRVRHTGYYQTKEEAKLNV